MIEITSSRSAAAFNAATSPCWKGLNAQLSLGGLQQAIEQIVRTAQVQQRYGARFAADATRLDDAPVGPSRDPVFLQAGHDVLCIP